MTSYIKKSIAHIMVSSKQALHFDVFDGALMRKKTKSEFILTQVLHHGQDVTQGQFLKRCTAGLNS